MSVSRLAKRVLQTKRQLLRGQQIRHIDNGADVLAVAHVDFIDVGVPLAIGHRGDILSSRLDDRLGVHAILDVLPTLGVNVDVLLTTDEEQCQSTARLFVPEKHYRYAISFDRAGDDAVLYGDWPILESSVAEFWTIGRGSYSDVAELSFPGVNLGVGYQNQHTARCIANYDNFLSLVERYAVAHETWCGIDFAGEEWAPFALDLTGVSKYDF